MTIDHSHLRDPSTEEFDTRTVLREARNQAKARHYDEFLIVDADAHHYETESFDEIFQFIEDPVLRFTAQAGRQKGGGRAGLMSTQPGFQDVGGRITRYTKRTTEKTPPQPHRDITLTKRWMDSLGVDMVCLFPTPMLTLGLHPQVEVEVELSRAYNRWLCEVILAKEKRFHSMLYLPFNDPDATYKTIKEFGEKPGVTGFMVTSARYRPVHDKEYMRSFALLEEMNKPLSFHAIYNWNDPTFRVMNRFLSIHALGFTVYNMIHLTNWVVNGLPERFPNLKTVWIESGLAWIPFLMQRLDNEYMMRRSEAPMLKKLPSDYIRDMYFTSQPMEMVNNRAALEHTFEMINAKTQLLYASDYPHWDMDLPSTIYDLPFLTEQDKRNILGGNAQRLFNLEPVFSEEKIEARRKKGLPC